MIPTTFFLCFVIIIVVCGLPDSHWNRRIIKTNGFPQVYRPKHLKQCHFTNKSNTIIWLWLLILPVPLKSFQLEFIQLRILMQGWSKISPHGFRNNFKLVKWICRINHQNSAWFESNLYVSWIATVLAMGFFSGHKILAKNFFAYSRTTQKYR